MFRIGGEQVTLQGATKGHNNDSTRGRRNSRYRQVGALRSFHDPLRLTSDCSQSDALFARSNIPGFKVEEIRRLPISPNLGATYYLYHNYRDCSGKRARLRASAL